jgi:diadenylate cyclase
VSDLLNSIRLADLADVFIVSVCVYLILRWIQTTASHGLAITSTVVVGIYIVALEFNLHLTTLLFQFGLTIAAVVFVVVFQDDIRRAVERVLLASRWRSRISESMTHPHVETLITTAFDLASNRRGALIVVAGDEPLDTHIEGGTELLGRISQPLLDSLFDPHSAGHDGAVIIQDNFVTRFGVHLPLSENRQKSAGLGTRHRSGLGRSEQSDALVIVVSEERGQVSTASQGELRRNVSREDLNAVLSGHLSVLPINPASTYEGAFGSDRIRHLVDRGFRSRSGPASLCGSHRIPKRNAWCRTAGLDPDGSPSHVLGQRAGISVCGSECSEDLGRRERSRSR